VTATATVWRTCPVCGASFEQPDDPGRKRVYCSRACQQAAYRARQRANGASGASGAGQWHSQRQEQRSDQRRQRAGSGGSGTGQRQAGEQQRQANDDAWWRARQRYQRGGQRRQEQRQPPPSGANGQRPGATSGGYRQRPKVNCWQCHGLRARGHTFHHDQAAHDRARRRYEALLRKAAGTPFEPEATACRTKAEALYVKYGL
jgi:hypothetical protein